MGAGGSHFFSCGTCNEWEQCIRGLCVEEPDEEEEGCLFIPDGGRCADLFRIERCVEGEEGAEVVEERCASGELCELGGDGAACRPLPENCEVAFSICTEEGKVSFCEDGKRVELPCPHGCSHFDGEARCRERLAGTVLRQGKIFYEHELPNTEMTGWGDSELRPAGHLAVLSLGASELLDASLVRADGSFELLVREEPLPEDRLIFVAQARLMGRETAMVAAVDPDLPPGMHEAPGLEGGTPWAWSFKAEESEEDLVISVEMGSGAVQAFQALYATVSHVASIQGPNLPPLLAFWAPGVDFSCGACFANTYGILLSGGEFQAHRSDSVLLHEAGHYAFRAFGVLPLESGIHCLGVPAPPGQAFSEGHASWYSADLRRSPIHYAEHYGTFCFVDFDKREPGTYFEPPRPEYGRHQPMNETWVTATLWQLAKSQKDSRIIHEAMTGPELQVPSRGQPRDSRFIATAETRFSTPLG